MKIAESDALAFAEILIQYYFEQRDYDDLLSYVDPDFVMIGTGAEEYTRGMMEFEALMRAEQVGFSSTFRLLNKELQVLPLADELCMVNGFVEVVEDNTVLLMNPLRLRVSAVICQKEGRLLLKQIHLSVGSSTQRARDYFPTEVSERGDRRLRQMLDEQSAALHARNSELQALSNNVPGGVLRCLYNIYLPLQQISNGFLLLFGYSRAEISTLFRGHFCEMIHPDDRESARESLERQMREGCTEEREYRVVRKDGGVIWVLERGQLVRSENGEESLYCVLLDITREKRNREELRLSLERHRIIMNQTRDIIFEWDTTRDTIDFSANFGEKFGYELSVGKVVGVSSLQGRIHSDDLPRFAELREKLLYGSPYAQTEIRIQKKDAGYLWCRVRATGQRDADGKLLKAVGVILDIDSEKKMVNRLQEKAERDALTGLYNKMTAQKLIEHALFISDEEQKDALLVLDLDNFKLVNDRFGHLMGDALLTDVASGLKKLFRSTDVIGRVGGDEFVVFLRNIPSEKFAEEQAQRIVKLFAELFDVGFDDIGISCSIGVTICGSKGQDFQKLFNSTDLALYRAKSEGKNRCVVFDAEKDFARSYVGITAIDSKIDSDQQGVPDTSDIVSYVFHALYESSDISEAVGVILEAVGRQFNVSRVYIFEDSEDGTCCSNTFEWCNTGITPMRGKLQNVPYADLGDYYSNFNEDGIFYCQDVAHLTQEVNSYVGSQQVKAMLQCVLRDNGKNRGYVGFDECDTQRFWTQEQVDTLVLIGEILCVFLLKQHVQERIARTVEQLREVLDSQNAWIYAIDKESYELLYLNKKTRLLGLNLYPGVRCYEAFFGYDKPCEICPRKNKKDGGLRSMEIYNPLLKLWTLVELTELMWEGSAAQLITCVDITNYKA